MSRALRLPFVFALLAGAVPSLAAQTTALSPSPTLPSDTLEANYGPRSAQGPMPELAPSLPSDTLEAAQPVDSLPADSLRTDSMNGHSSSDDFSSDGSSSEGSSTSRSDPDDMFPDEAPMTPGDSAALRDLQSWMQRHPELTAPPPARAVLARA